jgi:hypothetical protein
MLRRQRQPKRILASRHPGKPVIDHDQEFQLVRGLWWRCEMPAAGIVNVACWAHARRKVFEAVKLNPRNQISIDITNTKSGPFELQATVPAYMIPFAPH